MLRSHPNYPYFNVGRKGPVIYYAWHDIPCARSYTKPRNPRTTKQQANRNLHGSLTRISGATKTFRSFCYGNLPSYRSSHTAFIGIQMCQLKRAKRGTELPLEARLRWGSGSLPGVRTMKFIRKEKCRLQWSCDKRRLTRQSDPDNRVLWIVWNATRGEWKWSLNGGKRQDGATSLDLPEQWQTDELYIRLLFYDPRKKVFSCDACLHVKAGDNSACLQMDEVSIFTRGGLSFEDLVGDWIHSRSFVGRKRMELQEQLE